MNNLQRKIRQLRINAVRKSLKKYIGKLDSGNAGFLKDQWNPSQKFAMRKRYVVGGNENSSCRVFATYGDKAMLDIFNALHYKLNAGTHHYLDSVGLSDHRNRLAIHDYVHGEGSSRHETLVGLLFTNGRLDKDSEVGHHFTDVDVLRKIHQAEIDALSDCSIEDRESPSVQFDVDQTHIEILLSTGMHRTEAWYCLAPYDVRVTDQLKEHIKSTKHLTSFMEPRPNDQPQLEAPDYANDHADDERFALKA